MKYLARDYFIFIPILISKDCYWPKHCHKEILKEFCFFICIRLLSDAGKLPEGTFCQLPIFYTLNQDISLFPQLPLWTRDGKIIIDA